MNAPNETHSFITHVKLGFVAFYDMPKTESVY